MYWFIDKALKSSETKKKENLAVIYAIVYVFGLHMNIRSNIHNKPLSFPRLHILSIKHYSYLNLLSSCIRI